MNKEEILKRAEDIKADIEKAKKELAEVAGEKCEVYTRIVGYYRPIDNWNAGKAEEYKGRVEFKVE